MDIRKVLGPDSLPKLISRYFCISLCDPLAWIFNWSIGDGVVPTISEKANVVAMGKNIENKTADVSRARYKTNNQQGLRVIRWQVMH